MNTDINLRDIAQSWAAVQALEEGTAEYQEQEWALRSMGNLIALHPPEAWRVVERVFEDNLTDPWVIENLGAGPVETLLRMHGEETLPLLLSYLSRNNEFVSVLRHVWDDSLPEKIREELRSHLSWTIDK